MNDPPLEISLSNQMRVDSTGNFIISGVDKYIWGTPNKLSIVKFSPNFEKIGRFVYTDSSRTFSAADMEIDANNDIIMVGSAVNMFGDGQRRGYFLKISNDVVTSIHDVPIANLEDKILIAPNPVSNRLCVIHPNRQLSVVRLWDISGRMILEQYSSLLGEKDCFELPVNLTNGIYCAAMYFDDGDVQWQKVAIIR